MQVLGCTTGIVYVADGVLGAGNQGRVLVFEPPYTNGMAATDILNTVFGEPTGLEISADNSLWVNDSDNGRFLRFSNGALQETISGVPSRLWGGIGVDHDGSVLTTGWDCKDPIFSTNQKWTTRDREPRLFLWFFLFGRVEQERTGYLVGPSHRLLITFNAGN